MALSNLDQSAWWWRQNPLIWLLALLFWGVAKFRAFLYFCGILASRQLPGSVLSVGNIAAGGTGKTPTVIALASILRQQHKTAILTRGYGSGLSRGQVILILGGKVVWSSVSNAAPYRPDEALLQSQKLPGVWIVVGSDRYQAAMELLRFNKNKPIDLWILDDGFQHLKLRRNFDLVLTDANRQWLRDFPIPLGRLREGIRSIRRADALLYTRAASNQMRIVEDLFDVKCFFSEIKYLQAYSAENSQSILDPQNSPKIALAAAIAHPEKFRTAVQSLGFEVLKTCFIGDHQSFVEASILELLHSGAPILITEKDYFRQPEFWQRPQVYVLPIRFEIPQLLLDLIKEKIL